MFKKIKNTLTHFVRNVRFPWRKRSLLDQMYSFGLRYKKQMLMILGIILAIFVYQWTIVLVKNISFVKPQILSREGNNHWEKIDQFYYDPVDIVTYTGNVLLVDIRREEQFKGEHIQGAVNIPVEVDSETGLEIVNKKELIEAFKKLDKQKQIVIYGDNAYSLKPIKTAELMTTKGYPVKVMQIGWNEFRHLQNFWLPEHLWNKVNIIDFIEGDLITP